MTVGLAGWGPSTPASWELLFSRRISFLSVVVVQSPSHIRLCSPMDCGTPGFSVLHQLPELAQTHVHCVSDAIQPSHPLSPPSSALSLSQHQGLFQQVGSSHHVAKVLSPCESYEKLNMLANDICVTIFTRLSKSHPNLNINELPFGLLLFSFKEMLCCH